MNRTAHSPIHPVIQGLLALAAKLAKVPGLGLVVRTLLFMATVLIPLTARAEVPTELTGLVTDATTFFTSIKSFVISVVVFIILIGFAKLLRKK